MEHLVQAVQRIADVSSSQARLALLIVADATRSQLPEREALALAAALPLELALLVGRASDDALDVLGTLDELAELLDERTISAACSVLAMAAPPELVGRLRGEIPATVTRMIAATAVPPRRIAASKRPTVRALALRPTVRVCSVA